MRSISLLVGACTDDVAMGEVFIGSEALASGALTRHELVRFHDRVLPDVYRARGKPVSLHERTVAAWLWSRRRAVIAGAAAAALHGAVGERR